MSALRALSLSLIAFAGAARAETAPQYVIISFDGAKDISQWERSRALARQTGASFTYFLSCAYLLSPETRSLYKPPASAPSRSNVGFAESREDVAARLRQIWTAHLEGHEMASHACGHFDGRDWSAREWGQEFSEFSRITQQAWALNSIPFEPAGWKAFAKGGIVGFRAPYLSVSKGLETALQNSAMDYDASAVSRQPGPPAAKAGIARFALPMIAEGPAGRLVLSMDYNLFVRHSGGFERPDRDSAFENRAHDAFKAAFDNAYGGRRPPLQIGLHFTLMNGGAYWRALERFVKETCTRPNVRCVSYKTYLKETGRAPRSPS